MRLRIRLCALCGALILSHSSLFPQSRPVFVSRSAGDFTPGVQSSSPNDPLVQRSLADGQVPSLGGEPSGGWDDPFFTPTILTGVPLTPAPGGVLAEGMRSDPDYLLVQ